MLRSFRVVVAVAALSALPELPDAVRTELRDLSSELGAVSPLIDKVSVCTRFQQYWLDPTVDFSPDPVQPSISLPCC